MAKVKRQSRTLRSKVRSMSAPTRSAGHTLTVAGALNFYDYKVCGDLNGHPQSGCQLYFLESQAVVGEK